MKSRDEAGGSRIETILVWTVAAVCFGTLGWFARQATFKPPAMANPMAAMMGGAGGPPAVVVETVAEEAINPPRSFVGHVEPLQEVELLARVNGYVREIHFQEGARVNAGDLLFTIDDEEYAARLEQRRAELVRAEAELDQADRYLKRLVSSDVRGVSQAELDKARSDEAQAKAMILQAKANMSLAEIDLKHTKLLAPIAGKIGKVLAHTGDYVSPSAGALAKIVQVDPIRVVFSVADRDFLTFKQHVAATGSEQSVRTRLTLPGGTEYGATGAWDFVDNTMSAATATLPVRVRFANPDGLLVPNGYVTVLVDQADAPRRPVVDQRAVVRDLQGTFVFVVGANELVEQRRVKLGDSADGRVAVADGLAAGERVVVEGVQKVMPGKPVAVSVVPPKGA